MPIPCPHFKITIVKRSQGQSAVAGAAYQSSERLFSEYDQRTKFYNKKKELVHAEIMLPSHAPPGFADRATLWNAVETVENQWNSQLARRIVLAFPVEVPKEQYPPLMEKPMNQKPSLHQMEHYQKFYENGEYVRAVESTTEQNYNMIDGCANNLPKPRIINGRESVLDKLRIRQMAREKQKSSQEQSADMERNRK